MNWMKQPIAFRVQRFLGGLHYPAKKHEVIEHALRRGAEPEVIRALEGLGAREFASPTALAASMATC
jgi:Protein of unknown function (DUF2795)